MKEEYWLEGPPPEEEGLKFFESEISGRLKVRYLDNKKILNTQHTNYSYGMLEEVLNYGLDSIPVENLNSALVLGLGAGCVVGSLRKRYNFSGPIKGVEIDPVVLQIAEEEFDLSADENLEIICADAFEFVQTTKEKFDLVIVDIFIDIEVPNLFYQEEFWFHVKKLMNKNGFVLFNAGIDLTEEKLNEFLDILPEKFLYQIIFEVYISNTLVILNKFED